MRGHRSAAIGLGVIALLSLAACDPEGVLDSAFGAVGSPGKVVVSGWAYDADAPDTVVAVRIDVDDRPVATVAADRSRPDVAAAKGIRDATGFLAEVTAAPGVRIVCVHALNVAGTDGTDALIGCDFVTVPSLRPVAHQLSLVEGSGAAPLSEGLKWVISDPQGDRVNCRIDWDGGAWDDTIANCHSRIGAFHVYDAPGTYQVALEMSDGNSGVAMAYRTVVVTGTPAERFDIQLRDNGGFTAGQFATVSAAAERWKATITTGLPGGTVSIPPGDCEAGIPAYSGSIDDLLIDVVAKPVDGAGGILAIAGPCWMRSSSGLPLYGVLVVDSADVAGLYAVGRLDDTVLHEMGHVLGIGILWDQPPLVGAGGPDPRFVGPMASIAANEWFTGWTSVPVENVGGAGTADAHWRESMLGPELMTGFIDEVNVLSAVTIGSLVDIGYHVDIRAAEPLPRPALRAGLPPDPVVLEERLIGPTRVVE